MGGGSAVGTITAADVELEMQGLSGAASATVTSGSTTSFTLTLASDSAFSTMTGATSVTVFQQPGTTIAGVSSIASGSSMHAFGLLFYDAGQWKVVAARMGAN
jgi:hypothetical protein